MATWFDYIKRRNYGRFGREIPDKYIGTPDASSQWFDYWMAPDGGFMMNLAAGAGQQKVLARPDAAGNELYYQKLKPQMEKMWADMNAAERGGTLAHYQADSFVPKWFVDFLTGLSGGQKPE